MPSVRRRSVSLVCDDAAISRTAAALLARHGLTDFGYVGARLDAAWARWDAVRREAFLRTLAAKGFSARVYAPPKRKAGSKAESAALAAWLRGLPKPCGLFVSYDQRAMRVLNLCRAGGIAVPEQIQIVGADNEAWICESTSPTLTSIEPDFEGAGFRAAEALLAMMDGAPGDRTETFGVRRTVERMSTTDAHGRASRAVRARNYIRSHVGEPLTVARLAERLNCSLRTLQSSYRAVFGATVWDDIAEARLGKAKELLAGTRTPVAEIPALVGVESLRHFMRFFKARTGMSMREWRKRGK
jgi:LacI family transcriptional regulator